MEVPSFFRVKGEAKIESADNTLHLFICNFLKYFLYFMNEKKETDFGIIMYVYPCVRVCVPSQ